MKPKKIALPEATEPQYITPYLPADAEQDIEICERSGKAAFIKVIAQSANAEECKNCAGIGFIYVSFCRAGPIKYHPGSGSIGIWHDGDHLHGRGWYVVGETRAYPCPHCGKMGG